MTVAVESLRGTGTKGICEKSTKGAKITELCLGHNSIMDQGLIENPVQRSGALQGIAPMLKLGANTVELLDLTGTRLRPTESIVSQRISRPNCSNALDLRTAFGVACHVARQSVVLIPVSTQSPFGGAWLLQPLRRRCVCTARGGARRVPGSSYSCKWIEASNAGRVWAGEPTSLMPRQFFVSCARSPRRNAFSRAHGVCLGWFSAAAVFPLRLSSRTARLRGCHTEHLWMSWVRSSGQASRP